MMKRKVIPILLAGMVLALAAFPTCIRAQARDRFVLENERILISGDAASEGYGRSIAEAFPGIASDLESVLGWKFLNRPLVLLVGDRAEFERISGTTLIAAFAVPREHLVVIGLPSVEQQPYLLNETFKHEVCHLLLHDHIPSGLPKWLDEGVCQWVSGSLGELLVGREGGLAGSVDLAQHAVPLSSLDDTFPGGKLGLAAAYEQSRSFVDYIVRVHGKAELLGILDRLAKGEPIEKAVQGSLGKPLSTIEADWRADLSTKRIWLIRLGEYLYDILFFLAAIVTGIGGLVLSIRRKRRRLEQMDEEDEEWVEGEEESDGEGEAAVGEEEADHEEDADREDGREVIEPESIEDEPEREEDDREREEITNERVKSRTDE